MQHFEQQKLFIGGEGGYVLYRIPALAVSVKGTILAFCEARKFTGADSDQIDLILRRSFDGGRTFEDVQMVATQQDWVCGNPSPVVDHATGTIWLLFCKNLKDGGETMIHEGKAPRTVWVTASRDDGDSWAEPKEISQSVKLPEWSWYATGPGHGIQIKSGRLVIPANHTVIKNRNREDPHHSHVIFSDDHGNSWQLGGSSDPQTNESTILESDDGQLVLNSRNQKNHFTLLDSQSYYRAVAWSGNEGVSFSPVVHDAALIEPACQGSLVRYSLRETHSRNRVLFSNPASKTRDHLTVRLSYDECRTWSVSRELHAGPSAYSDLCVTSDLSICCLYECGDSNPYEAISLARFNLEWLTNGAEKTAGRR